MERRRADSERHHRSCGRRRRTTSEVRDVVPERLSRYPDRRRRRVAGDQRCPSTGHGLARAKNVGPTLTCWHRFGVSPADSHLHVHKRRLNRCGGLIRHLDTRGDGPQPRPILRGDRRHGTKAPARTALRTLHRRLRLGHRRNRNRRRWRRGGSRGRRSNGCHRLNSGRRWRRCRCRRRLHCGRSCHGNRGGRGGSRRPRRRSNRTRSYRFLGGAGTPGHGQKRCHRGSAGQHACAHDCSHIYVPSARTTGGRVTTRRCVGRSPPTPRLIATARATRPFGSVDEVEVNHRRRPRPGEPPDTVRMLFDSGWPPQFSHTRRRGFGRSTRL